MSVRRFDATFYRKQVKSDCEELLGRFQRTQSVRFEVFANIWREMEFSQMFWGTRNTVRRAFSRLVLDTVYSYFLPPFSFQIRVGGLYLLHSLYHSQTTRPSEQIRLALKDWDDVKKFEREAVDAQHMDVVFILRQLMLFKAFSFTATPTVLTYSRKRTEDRSALCGDFVERASRPQELISGELLEELSNIHSLYTNMKTSAVSQMTSPADSSVNLIQKDLVSQLHSTVLDFYSWQRRQETADEHENSQEGVSSQQESSSRAELRASIKSKAYGEAAEVTKSRRHRQVEMFSTPEETEPVLKSASNRTVKPSLRIRTNEMLPISEASDWTQIFRLSTLESVSEKEPQKKKPLE
ncbi:snRNA-activating protein complex subunit 1b [Austrofundulus limnaeus]|uniref:snRNA-activating protein complex subunit 1b n=1 Tax=Austrofundulus limnaeus TaxID=52670 RepID=A0A2I4CSD6_AUSLI|nr:PREDICTED: snRNA-activating protein complex subunit 1 [Austrofundulus limnaeus]